VQSAGEAWGHHRHFAFVACPHGDEWDSHRAWEALLLGSIPIVRSSALDPLYAGLPVVIVREWAEVTCARLAGWRERLAPLFSAELLQRRLSAASAARAIGEAQRRLRLG
jgi:hypothetical protein